MALMISFGWLHYAMTLDARQRSSAVGFWTTMLLIFLQPLGMLVYSVRSRGWQCYRPLLWYVLGFMVYLLAAYPFLLFLPLVQR